METQLQTVKLLISQRTGLAFRDQDLDQLRTVISTRIRANSFSSVDEYFSLLAGASRTSEREWRRLVSLLTVGESYFFRDHDQFKLIRERILPELVARRKNTRSLNIWSAGCSTGEETYSLAIALSEVLFDNQDWQVAIVGTDINEEAIEKARRGIFGPWSFRGVSSDVKHQYFQHGAQGWEIDDRIRRTVDFRIDNLLETGKAPLWRHDSVDLIVCRNVFIYFNRQAVTQVIDSFVAALADEGFLMTGHGELMGLGLDFKRLRPRIYSESVVYQKTALGKPTIRDTSVEVKRELIPVRQRSVPARARKPLPEVRQEGRDVRSQPVGITGDNHATLRRLFRRGDYRAVIELGERMLEENARNLATYPLLARTYANLGMYDKATELCARMLQINADCAIAYLLLAQVAEAREDYEEAKGLLKRVIYLDATCAAAYVELGSLYDREGESKRAKAMRRSAVEVLKSQPPETVIEPYDSVTAGELIGYLLASG